LEPSPVDDVEAAREAAHEIGYPLMLKATAGGEDAVFALSPQTRS